MEQSQLIELISTIAPEDKAQILQFASITMFNNGRMRAYVGPLLDICIKHPWHDQEQVLEKRAVFNALFTGQEFVEGKLEKVMVEAHKVVRSFMLSKYYFREENDFQQVLDFSEIVREQNLEARYQHLLTKLQKIQNYSQKGNVSYFHRQYLLEYAIHDEECQRNQKKGNLNIPPTIKALEMHYHLNRLALLNRFLLQQKVANIEIPETMRPLLVENEVPERFLEDSSYLLVSYTISNLLRKKHPEPADARGLLDLLKLHEPNLDADALKEYYTYLRNICVLVLRNGQESEEINFTLYELYKDNLDRGYLHYEGKLHPSRYLAISDLAARVKQYEWWLAFIEKYKHDIIGENETQDIYRFNMASYLFGIGKYSECLDFIPATSPFVDYLLHGKRLELKALFELKSDLFSYKLDAFKMFLSRTSQKILPDMQRQKNVDFNNLLTQIAASTPGDQKRAQRVIKHVDENRNAVDWPWLLAKANALKGR